jgi:putative tryptophan/tyrosine transport system substrate-binding protein
MIVTRREFIALVGGAAASPLSVGAQQQDHKRTVGVLMNQASEGVGAGRAQIAALRDELSKRGWVDGHNLQVEPRWTGSRGDLIQKYATELVTMPSDVIVSSSSPLLAALERETSTLPIVFIFVSDPVAQGFVKNLPRPGGNVTGFTAFEPSLGGKWVELLKELVPNINRVILLFSPKGAPNAPLFIRFAETSAASHGITISSKLVDEDTANFELIMEEIARDPGGGIVLLPDAFTASRISQIVPAAVRFRLPMMSPFPLFAQAGALVSYGVNQPEQMRRAASYVDRILRGEKPGELPVQEPTTFELVLNLKTAKALGIIVPPSLLSRADEVIE